MRQLHYSNTDQKDRKTRTGSSIVNITRVTPFIIFLTLPVDECYNSIS